MDAPTISDLRRQIAGAKVSCSEVLEAHIAQIEARNPELNALPTLCLDRARAESRRLDDQLVRSRKTKANAPLGPLTGMPYAAKDMFDTEGVRTTYGSPLFQDHIPQRDAEIVRRVRASGAVLIGKSNTPEFAGQSDV